MRNDVAALLALFGGSAVVSGNADPAQGQTAPAVGGLTRGAFSQPNTGVPAGATTFTPVSTENLFATQVVAKTGRAAQKQAMQLYAEQVTQMVEQAYTNYGYSKNDVGVAFAALLETCWEMSNGTFKIGDGTDEEKAKTKTAVRQMQNALLASPAYKTLADKNKQMLYEACTFMMGHLATQWQQAGNDAAKKSAVQQQARQQFQTIFGMDASKLTRKPNGTFVGVGGGTGALVATHSAVRASAKTPETKTLGTAATTSATPSGQPLPAASAHGAQIFVKYSFQATTTSFGQLILFPSGAAFTDIPSKPVAQFDEVTLRASLKPFDVGTWKQNGNTITLTFPNKKRDQVTTLHKVPRGWYDGDDKPDPESAYETYFPVVLLTPDKLTGAWSSKSLTTMGMMGGGAPMVAAGSNSDRTFQSNGTFTGGKKSFASSTTANMGDAFKSGGDVGVYGTNNKSSAGRWRLDGPLLTMEQNGQRTVTLAYILPHWNKSGVTELLIDGDWWKRPEKD